MLRRKTQNLKSSAGFTLLELLVSIIIFTIVVITFSAFFQQSLLGYAHMQANASALTNLYVNTARVTKVLRGVTQIDSATSNDLVAYAYFNPNDTYVSKLHYYIDTSGAHPVFKVDLTPMSANPPTGTPITADQQTYTIVDNYYQEPDVNLFTYLGLNDQVLTPPISDINSIKSIKVSLAMKTDANATYSTTLRVTLRNMEL